MPHDNKAVPSWPPEYFAVLEDPNGEPCYLRPSEFNESLEQFADRIGKMVTHQIEYSGTCFVDVIEGATGQSSVEAVALVTSAMAAHRTKREETKHVLGLS